MENREQGTDEIIIFFILNPNLLQNTCILPSSSQIQNYQLINE